MVIGHRVNNVKICFSFRSLSHKFVASKFSLAGHLYTQDLEVLADIREDEDLLLMYNAAASLRDAHHKIITFSPKVCHPVAPQDRTAGLVGALPMRYQD